jgi:hypothetical protein
MNAIDRLRRDSVGNFLIVDRAVQMPALPERFANAEPAIRFAAAAEQTDELGALTAKIENDQTLSDLGKTQRLDPERETLIRRLAGHVIELDKFEQRIDAREAKLLEVPILHREAAAEAIVDAEIRTWWRTLPQPERAQLMQRMNDEPGHERVEIALLRAPYGRIDIEIGAIREAWDTAKRLDNPAEASAIADAREVLAWARRGFGHLIAIAGLVTRFPVERVLAIIAKDNSLAAAAPAFGFDAEQLEQGRRMLDAAARRRSA